MYELLHNGGFRSRTELAEAIGISVSVVSETVNFYMDISLEEQRRLRASGDVTSRLP